MPASSDRLTSVYCSGITVLSKWVGACVAMTTWPYLDRTVVQLDCLYRWSHATGSTFLLGCNLWLQLLWYYTADNYDHLCKHEPKPD